MTRERLLRAGERLFAERGIDGVRVREINQLAGQRNSSALHYHFGSRDGLLDEIKLSHRTPIEARRIAMLDGLERDGRTDDLRALVETLVLPFTGGARHRIGSRLPAHHSASHRAASACPVDSSPIHSDIAGSGARSGTCTGASPSSPPTLREERLERRVGVRQQRDRAARPRHRTRRPRSGSRKSSSSPTSSTWPWVRSRRQ